MYAKNSCLTANSFDFVSAEQLQLLAVRYLSGTPWLRTANYMQMQMVHLLTAIGSSVEESFEATTALRVSITDITTTLPSSQLWCQQQHVGKKVSMCFGAVGKRGDMLLRHDQKMDRCGWVDIVKRKYLIVFVNDFRGELLCRDLAENTVTHASLFYL